MQQCHPIQGLGITQLRNLLTNMCRHKLTYSYQSFGFVYLSDKRSEEKIDWVIELVEKFSKIQEMRYERKKNN